LEEIGSDLLAFRKIVEALHGSPYDTAGILEVERREGRETETFRDSFERSDGRFPEIWILRGDVEEDVARCASASCRGDHDIGVSEDLGEDLLRFGQVEGEMRLDVHEERLNIHAELVVDLEESRRRGGSSETNPEVGVGEHERTDAAGTGDFSLIGHDENVSNSPVEKTRIDPEVLVEYFHEL